MNLKTFSDDTLMEELKLSVSKERDVTIRVLWLLREVERRMLYAARGYSSLFSYCVSELRYSESAAMRRISSMRLLRDLSDESRELVEKKIAGGELSLSHLNQVQRHFRSEASKAGTARRQISTQSEKVALLDQISNTSARECEQILAALNPVMVKVAEKIRSLDGENLSVVFTISKILMKKIERVQNARAHQLKSKTISELLELLVDEEVNRDEKKKGVSSIPRAAPLPTSKVRNVTVCELNITQIDRVSGRARERALMKKSVVTPSACSKAEKAGSESSEIKNSDAENTCAQNWSRYIKRADYRALYKEADHQCQYTDKKTGKRCGSRYRLQVEHCHPFSLGGSSDLGNLQLLCSTHNALRAQKVFNLLETSTRVGDSQ